METRIAKTRKVISVVCILVAFVAISISFDDAMESSKFVLYTLGQTFVFLAGIAIGYKMYCKNKAEEGLSEELASSLKHQHDNQD